MNVKITPARLEVLMKLADGWEAAISRRIGEFAAERAWIQHGGAGKGGKSEKVRKATLEFLLGAGLIKRERADHITTAFNITDKGAALVAERRK